MTKFKLIFGSIIVLLILVLGMVAVLFSIPFWMLFRSFNAALVIDKLDNLVFFGGQTGETVSSHTGRWYVSGRTDIPWKFQFVHKLCDWTQPGHCETHIEPQFKDAPL